MKALLSKLETLADEAIGLVREERARRNATPWLGARPDLYGPKGTEIHWGTHTFPPPPPGGNGILDTPKID